MSKVKFTNVDGTKIEIDSVLVTRVSEGHNTASTRVSLSDEDIVVLGGEADVREALGFTDTSTETYSQPSVLGGRGSKVETLPEGDKLEDAPFSGDYVADVTPPAAEEAPVADEPAPEVEPTPAVTETFVDAPEGVVKDEKVEDDVVVVPVAVEEVEDAPVEKVSAEKTDAADDADKDTTPAKPAAKKPAAKK
jgi:hypothetical protein